MVKPTQGQRCQIGLDFFEFLKETDRESITDRLQLRDIYNGEFRRRDPGSRDPNFGSVLYALKASQKIQRRGDIIRFNNTVRHQYVDQWHTHRSRQPQPVQNGAASPVTPQAFVSGDEAETGVRARRKLASHLLKRLKTERAQFISDKNGISITCDDPFENGRLVLYEGETYEYKRVLNVKNIGPEPMCFTCYTPLQWLKCYTFEDKHKVTKQNPLLLSPGDSYEIKVHFRSSLFGVYPATLAFEFKPDLEPSSTTFYIVRFLDAHCMTSLGKELAPVAPYRPRSIPAWTAESPCEIVDGQPPEGRSTTYLLSVVPLRGFQMPQYMNQFINSLKKPTRTSDPKKALLESPLSWENYTEKFQMLLFLEEHQMQVDIKRYNMPNEDRPNVVMTRDPHNRNLLVLEVPGVSENRPSVLRGDALLVYPVGEKKVKYRGYVHSVQLDSVKLSFNSQLLSVFQEGMKFNVEFLVNRLTLKLQHRAAELATTHGLGKVLFPSAPPSSGLQTKPPQLSLFDKQLEKNPQQRQAIEHIVAGSSRPAPYLVFGPPGTGKTVTLVEAIKQIEKTQPNCHILACAPCNSATDLLCKKILHHVEKRKVHRMYATSRDPKSVPEELKEVSNLVGDNYVYYAKEELMEIRIIVTTLFSAGRLITGGIPPGHFTHVFVDEAGHAVECECLIPLAGLLDADSGQVVLAGDHKQLGPILRSPFALKYGMGESLLERLMNFPLYAKDNDVYNNCYVTKLLYNYRSHPAILKVPNELFYEKELVVCANEILRNSYCKWEPLPRKGFPLIFHGVNGEDAREASSPSFFNVAEIDMLMDYVKKLLQTRGKKGLANIAPRDIGIIAPYRKQVQKIRQALGKVGKKLKITDMGDLKVGSVEEFQGQERTVILVSTVRSSSNYIDMDQQFNLGFVKNEKRFNVAVTRAKALLIVVGNPRILRKEASWAHFIQYCTSEGGVTGFMDTEDVDDVIQMLACLCIDMEPKVETDESFVQQMLHPEWRNDM